MRSVGKHRAQAPFAWHSRHEAKNHFQIRATKTGIMSKDT